MDTFNLLSKWTVNAVYVFNKTNAGILIFVYVCHVCMVKFLFERKNNWHVIWYNFLWTDLHTCKNFMNGSVIIKDK